MVVRLTLAEESQACSSVSVSSRGTPPAKPIRPATHRRPLASTSQPGCPAAVPVEAIACDPESIPGTQRV